MAFNRESALLTGKGRITDVKMKNNSSLVLTELHYPIGLEPKCRDAPNGIFLAHSEHLQTRNILLIQFFYKKKYSLKIYLKCKTIYIIKIKD